MDKNTLNIHKVRLIIVFRLGKMSLKSFIQQVSALLFSTECNINTKFRFSQSEINEILANADSDNVKYFESLAKIKELSAFDVSYLMSKVKLDDRKISLISSACKMFDEKEFCALGQTFSDFIFRVSANINLLNESNLDVFKELVQCKNELYDFSKALKNPVKARHQRHSSKCAYAFENVFVQ